MAAQETAFEMSLTLAKVIVEMPLPSRQHVVSHDMATMERLLPEHRAVAISSLSNEVESRQQIEAMTVGMELSVRAMGVRAEIWNSLEKSRSSLLTQLALAVDSGEKDKLKSLLADNIYSLWFMSHVLSPYYTTHRDEMENMGVDVVNLVLLAQNIHKPGLNQHPEFNSPALPGASTAAAVPVSATTFAQAQGDGSRPWRNWITLANSKVPEADIYKHFGVLGTLTGKPAKELGTIYSNIIRFLDATEQTIREDAPELMTHPPGDINAVFSTEILRHPLGRIMRMLLEDRVKVAQEIAVHYDATIVPKVLHARLAVDISCYAEIASRLGLTPPAEIANPANRDLPQPGTSEPAPVSSEAVSVPASITTAQPANTVPTSSLSVETPGLKTGGGLFDYPKSYVPAGRSKEAAAGSAPTSNRDKGAAGDRENVPAKESILKQRMGQVRLQWLARKDKRQIRKKAAGRVPVTDGMGDTPAHYRSAMSQIRSLFIVVLAVLAMTVVYVGGRDYAWPFVQDFIAFKTAYFRHFGGKAEYVKVNGNIYVAGFLNPEDARRDNVSTNYTIGPGPKFLVLNSDHDIVQIRVYDLQRNVQAAIWVKKAYMAEIED